MLLKRFLLVFTHLRTCRCLLLLYLYKILSVFIYGSKSLLVFVDNPSNHITISKDKLYVCLPRLIPPSYRLLMIQQNMFDLRSSRSGIPFHNRKFPVSDQQRKLEVACTQSHLLDNVLKCEPDGKDNCQFQFSTQLNSKSILGIFMHK